MTLESSYNLWGVAGLAYAFAGAALICNASFLTPPAFPKPFGSHATELGEDALRRISQLWLDTRIGAGLLAIGFFLQLTGAVGSTNLNKPAIFVLLALAIFAGYYALSKDLLADRLIPSESEASPEKINSETAPPPTLRVPEPKLDPIVLTERSDTAA
jgi:hypothetical protein